MTVERGQMGPPSGPADAADGYTPGGDAERGAARLRLSADFDGYSSSRHRRPCDTGNDTTLARHEGKLMHPGTPVPRPPQRAPHARPDREHHQWPKPGIPPYVQFRHPYCHTVTITSLEVSKSSACGPYRAVQGVRTDIPLTASIAGVSRIK
jgi:hypothetical protein